MKVVFFLLCTLLLVTAAASGLRVFEELTRRSPLFSIKWRHFLLPCRCSNAFLDCSRRGKSALAARDLCVQPEVVDLEENAFAHFPDGLRSALVVRMSHNELTSLPPASSLNSRLRELHLSDNYIVNASTEFRSLSSMEVLDVSRNFVLRHLRFLPQHCALRSLDASHNHIESLENDLENCTTLEKLDLSNNRLRSLDEDAFDELTELRFLDVSFNLFSSLAPNTFGTLSKLITLNMKGHPFRPSEIQQPSLVEISEGLFNSLIQLENLNLAFNSLTRVPIVPLPALANLKTLDISFNELETVPTNFLQNFSSLEELNLSGNKLTSISPAAFASNHRLKNLDLNGNNLTSLTAGVFSGLTELLELTISANPLQSLPLELFAATTQLEYVSLSHREANMTNYPALRNVPHVVLVADVDSIPARAFAALPNLAVLLAFGSGVRAVAERAFEGLHLRFLLIEGRGMTELPQLMLRGQSPLEYFVLYKCNLSTLPEEIFAGLNRLKLLFLYNNQLLHLSERLFHDLHSLESLDLSFNNLTTLPDGLFSNLSSLRELNLASNKLAVLPACDLFYSSLQNVSFVRNPFISVDRSTLKSWLNTGSTERQVLLTDSRSHIQTESVAWLLNETDVLLGAHGGSRCNCGAVRKGLVVVRLCVVTNCTNGDLNRDWIDVMRNSVCA